MWKFGTKTDGKKTDKLPAFTKNLSFSMVFHSKLVTQR